MDFSDERYVRIYTRDTPTWKMLGFEGQATLCLVLRKCARRGVFETAGMDPAKAASLIADIPLEFAAKGMARMFELGVAVLRSDHVYFPRFKEAQETAQSVAQRQREYRARQKEEPSSEEDEPSRFVTNVANSGHDSNESNAPRNVSVQHSTGSDLSFLSSDLRSEIAREEPAACKVVDLRSRQRSVAQVGYDWLLRVRGNGSCPDLETNLESYENIGRKSEVEREIVAKHAALTEYLRKKPSLRNPSHFVKYWESFLEGERNYASDRPGLAKGFHPGVPTSDEELRRAAADNPAWASEAAQ
jgi:hypothetical protein